MQRQTHSARILAIFFDLGDTLGAATVDSDSRRLTRFDVFPDILQGRGSTATGILPSLKEKGIPLGIISNTGKERGDAVNSILAPTGLLEYLRPDLLFYSADEGMTKESVELFHRAASRAGSEASACLFVGEDASERAVATRAGWRVCPHPSLIDEAWSANQ